MIQDYEFIGKNCLENIKFIIKEKKIKKILILAGKNSFKISGAQERLEKILSNITHRTFFKTNELPNLLDLKKFIAIINSFKPDLIVAVGGGAVLDLAKTSSCLFRENNLEENIKNSTYKIKKVCPVVAIPTTAGSGAEATSNAVIYIDKIKYSIESSKIKPDYILVDTELVMSAPASVAAAAGMDAIAQAIESLISKKSTPESVEFSKKSLEYSLPSFENHINRKNFENTYRMSLAALNAGKAINISKTTAPHAVSYPFTSYFGIKHGHAVVLTLPDFFILNFKNLKHAKVNFDLEKRFKIIFKVFKVTNIFNLEKKIKKISENTGLELNFNKLKINKKNQINVILRNINTQRLANNPIDIQVHDIEKILLSKI